MVLTNSAPGQPIVTDSIEEGLDRKCLLEVQRRFLFLNSQRLKRTYAALGHRQENFLQALPLLFHVNHPLLPGYHGAETPCGLSEYQPGKLDIQLVKGFARGFRYQKNIHRPPLIEALYVMGSPGTVAHGRDSDLDIWVCYAEGLTSEHQDLLKQKCSALSTAAKNIALDCHFFLMNAAEFRRGKHPGLSSEASGSTQHLLLLDEFYRTALWLGGKLPLWWLVPANREQHYNDYRHQLLSKRFVAEKRFIDFGAVPAIPPEEFAGAALWQLYKAIESPYKSVFKLLLLEAYTTAFPGFQPLCLSFKQAIYQGVVDANDLDPYILAYHRIEHYLQHRTQAHRLELARRCLYYKVNQALSRKPYAGTHAWQRALIKSCVSQWQWSTEKIANLDQRRQWKAAQVVQERQTLVNELLTAYKQLQVFKQRHKVTAAIHRDELNTLGHKLYACYERRPGKIDWINPGIALDLSEAQLCFVEDKVEAVNHLNANAGSSTWRVYPQSWEALENNNWRRVCPLPLKHSNLMELLLWCHCNGVLDKSTRCEFIFADNLETNTGSSAQMYPLIRAIQHWLPLPLAAVAHDTFKQRPSVSHILVHVNLGREPDKALHDKGLFHVSDIDDALSYGELKHNLVKSVDLVSRNSWNEVECKHFENSGANLLNNNALALCLSHCLQKCLSGPSRVAALPEIRVHCGSSACGNTVRYRVENLLKDVLQCYANKLLPLESRYLFSLEKGYYACQCESSGKQQVHARLEALPDEDALEDYLSRPQTRHSPIRFDRYTQVSDHLRLIAKVSDVRAINLAYQVVDNYARLIVVDEQGSLFRGSVPFFNETTLLRALHYFLRSCIRRQAALGGDFKADFDVFPIRFYKYSRRHDQAYLEPRHSGSALAQTQCLPITVVATSDALGHEKLLLKCGAKRLSQDQLGEGFFPKVRDFIMACRESGEQYPCYITDLDLSHYHLPGLNPERRQISHYLRFKVELERRINAP